MLTPLDIKIEFLKRGVTGGDIGREAGVTRAAVSQVVNRKRKSPRIRKVIAKALNLSYEQVWGEEDRAA